MTEIDKIKEKIQKLMALQEGAMKIGSFNEAANAAEKIQILLMKYNLSLGEVGTQKEKSNMNHIRFTMDDIGYNSKQGTWVIMLLRGAVKLNMCKLVTHTGFKSQFVGATILGSAENIELAKYTYDQLYNKVKTLEALEWKTYQGADLRGKFRRGFYMGAAMAIVGKVDKIIRDMEEGKVAEIDAIACTALIVKNEAKLAEYTAQIFPRLSLGKSLRSNGSDGVSLGYARGSEISFNKGLN